MDEFKENDRIIHTYTDDQSSYHPGKDGKPQRVENIVTYTAEGVFKRYAGTTMACVVLMRGFREIPKTVPISSLKKRE